MTVESDRNEYVKMVKKPLGAFKSDLRYFLSFRMHMKGLEKLKKVFWNRNSIFDYTVSAEEVERVNYIFSQSKKCRLSSSFENLDIGLTASDVGTRVSNYFYRRYMYHDRLRMRLNVQLDKEVFFETLDMSGFINYGEDKCKVNRKKNKSVDLSEVENNINSNTNNNSSNNSKKDFNDNDTNEKIVNVFNERSLPPTYSVGECNSHQSLPLPSSIKALPLPLPIKPLPAKALNSTSNVSTTKSKSSSSLIPVKLQPPVEVNRDTEDTKKRKDELDSAFMLVALGSLLRNNSRQVSDQQNKMFSEYINKTLLNNNNYNSSNVNHNENSRQPIIYNPSPHTKFPPLSYTRHVIKDDDNEDENECTINTFKYF